MGDSERVGSSGQCRAVYEHQSMCASRTDIPVVPCKEVRGAGSRGRIGGQMMRGNDATLRAERRTEVNAVSSTRAKTVAMGGEGGAKPSIKRLFSEGYLPPGFSHLRSHAVRARRTGISSCRPPTPAHPASCSPTWAAVVMSRL